MVEKSFKEKLTTAIVNFGLTSQMHGIPKLFNSNRLIFKFIWTMSLIFSSSICFWLIVKTIKTYLEYPIVTKINVVKNDSLQLPTITFCDLNPTIKKYNLSNKVLKCDILQVKNCTNNFIYYYDDWIQAYCYQLNGPENPLNISIKRPGFYNGISVSLFSSIIDEPRTKGLNLDVTDGLYVLIYDKFTNKNNIQSTNLKPGESTYIGVKKVSISKLSEPYNDCFQDETSYHSFDKKIYSVLNKNYTYKQRDCLDLGLFYFLNCSSLLNSSYLQDCLTNNFTREYIFKKYFEYFEYEIFKEYIPFCPIECSSLSYEVHVASHSLYPSYNEYLELMNNSNLISNLPKGKNTSLAELRESVLLANIYFTGIETTYITDSAKIETWDLVSNLGGLFSLFLGLSFLSLVDILQILIEIIILLFESL